MTGQKKTILEIINRFGKIMAYFVVIIVPADALAPLGTGPPAGFVMMKYGCQICTRQMIEGLNIWYVL